MVTEGLVGREEFLLLLLLQLEELLAEAMLILLCTLLPHLLLLLLLPLLLPLLPSSPYLGVHLRKFTAHSLHTVLWYLYT